VCAIQESNLGPLEYQSSALPAELIAHIFSKRSSNTTIKSANEKARLRCALDGLCLSANRSETVALDRCGRNAAFLDGDVVDLVVLTRLTNEDHWGANGDDQGDELPAEDEVGHSLLLAFPAGQTSRFGLRK
jgi:hypothetical protein